jgi:GntR family transcriptional regulator of arabinose operon
MTNHAILYGRPIFDSNPNFTLTDQVYEILREEIHAGRWEVGDRLPGAASLAETSCLSRWPLQQAFERLRNEGYLRQEKRSGSFLASRFAQSNGTAETIGIVLLMADEDGAWNTDRHSHYRLSALLNAAEKRNFLTEIKYLVETDDWDAVDRVGGLFGDHVIGVISLHPFLHTHCHQLPPGRLPFLYTGVNTSVCRPVVGGDTHLAYYMMTKRVIDHGHRNIICYCNSMNSEREIANRLLGHEKAMREGGLDVNRKAVECSLAIPNDDQRPYKLVKYIEGFSDATAVILMDGTVTGQLIAAANRLGRRVPDDLSVTGAGDSPPGLPEPGKSMTTIYYDTSNNMNICLDMLSMQRNTRTCPVSRLLVTPIIYDGDSLAACSSEAHSLAKETIGSAMS